LLKSVIQSVLSREISVQKLVSCAAEKNTQMTGETEIRYREAVSG
jgi:hypothetical protein